jgi:hypothetical protein
MRAVVDRVCEPVRAVCVCACVCVLACVNVGGRICQMQQAAVKVLASVGSSYYLEEQVL